MHEYIKVGEGVISWALTKAEPEIFRGEGWVLDVQGINQVLIFKGGGVLTKPSPLFLGPCMLVHMRNILQEYLLTKFLLLALLSHVAKITHLLIMKKKTFSFNNIFCWLSSPKYNSIYQFFFFNFYPYLSLNSK